MPAVEPAGLSSLAEALPEHSEALPEHSEALPEHAEPTPPKGARPHSTGGAGQARQEQETRLRALEERLRRSEAERARLEAILHAVDEGIELQNEFMARVSHELGAPLAAVILSLRLVLRRLPAVVDASASPSSESEEFRSYAETALWESERMRVLVGDLMDVSRLQRGKLTLRLQPEDLAPVVRRAVSLAQLGTRSQKLALDLPEAPVVVCGDTTRLEQVVINLLVNAMKHAPESERIDVRLYLQGSEAELQVQDYGPGISPDDLPHLFKRFFAAASGGAVQTGLGLGLYITKELVDAHGGRISVESHQGDGALFTVRLPLCEQPSETVYMCTVAGVPEPD